MFYYLLLGVSEEERREFQLKQPEDYLLNQVNSLEPQPQTQPAPPRAVYVPSQGVRGRARLALSSPQTSSKEAQSRRHKGVHSFPCLPGPLLASVPAKIILTHRPPSPEVPRALLTLFFSITSKIEDGEDLKHDFERLKQGHGDGGLPSCHQEAGVGPARHLPLAGGTSRRRPDLPGRNPAKESSPRRTEDCPH